MLPIQNMANIVMLLLVAWVMAVRHKTEVNGISNKQATFIPVQLFLFNLDFVQVEKRSIILQANADSLDG